VLARAISTSSVPGFPLPGRIEAAALRSRRFARLRVTALPTFRLAVKPTRTAATHPDPPGRRAACRIKPDVTARRRVAATRRKSARTLSVTSPPSVELRGDRGGSAEIRGSSG